MSDSKREVLSQINDLRYMIDKIYLDLIKITKISICGKYSKRWFCELHFKDGTKKHTQIARVLLEAKLGRVLDKKETVDHIDGNSLNNSLDNLQMLSLSDNAKKGSTEEVKIKNAELASKRLKGILKSEISCECNGSSKLTNEQVRFIKVEQLNYFKGQDQILANKYSVSKSTISRIRLNKNWKHLN